MNQPNLTTPRILWLALLMSQGLYLVILHMPGVVPPLSAPPDPILLYALAGAALFTAAGSFLLPAFLQKSAAPAQLNTVELPGVVESASYRAPNTTARGFQDRDEALREGLRRGMTPFIVRLALTESVALFGFVLGFLGHPLLSYLPFFIVAWLLMLARFPTESAFLRPIADASGVSL